LTLALVLAAALAVACVVVVALPFLREPTPESDALHELDAAERERQDHRSLPESEGEHELGQRQRHANRAERGPQTRDVPDPVHDGGRHQPARRRIRAVSAAGSTGRCAAE